MTDPLDCGQPAEVMDTENVDDMTRCEPFAPSCEEIPKDENLKYSDESFKQEIPVKKPSHDVIHVFPEPHVFAHFSIIAYDDDPKINSDLAPGWQILTAATNTKKQNLKLQVAKLLLQNVTGMDKNATASSNDYFGVAFWHPENHQLVIAHRGTIKTCFGALETDFHGIVHHKYVWQMFSAATFALELVAALRKHKQNFQLFFTGHSLGGWLAQINTFTIKYLHLAQTWSAGKFINCFHRLTPESIDSEKSTSVHAHTVVFDSPGCKPMLLKLADAFDVRYSGKIVQVNELDITSYMSAPNWVNTRNAHVGTIYRLYFPISKNVSVENIGTSWLNSFVKFKELWEKWDYTGAAHDKDNFLKVLMRENPKIREVVDWPESIGISGGKEFDGYLRWTTEEYAFFPPLKHSYSTELPGCYTIRYQVKVPENFKRSLNVFTQNERDFLEQYQLVRTFLDESDTEPSTEHQKLLSDYTIDGLYIHSSSVENINQLAAGVPFLLRNYENLSEQIKANLTPAGVATFDYLKSINQNDYSFNSNLEIVATILESAGGIWEFTAKNSTAAFIRFVDSLKNKFFTDHHLRYFRYVALSYEKLMELTSDQTFLPEEFNEGNHILVTNCGHLDDGQKKQIEKLKHWLQQSKNTNVKLILISSSNSNWNGNCGISSWEWTDLSIDTKRRLMGKKICLQGKYVVLSNILFNMGRLENLSEKNFNPDFKFKLSENDIMRLIASDSLTVSVGGLPPRISELEAAFVKCGNSKLFSFVRDEDSVVKFIEQCDEKNVIFCISLVAPSLPLENRLKEIQEQNKHKVCIERVGFRGNNFFEVNEQNFKEFCKENKLRRAYWLSIIKDETQTEVWNWKLEMMFDANFFVDRNIFRVAVNKFVRGNISEFMFLNFPSTKTIRSRLNVRDQELSDEKLLNQMIRQAEPFDDADVDAIPANEMKHILMPSEDFPEEFVLYQKPSQDNLDVFRGKNIFLLVDEPGMGKSTTLVKLGEAEYESYWVVHISLRNCNSKKTTAQNLQNFLWSHGCGNEKDLLEKALFHFRLQHIKQVEKPFLFLIDGYDEIQTTEFQNHVAVLLQKLNEKIVKTNHRMIVATRRYPPLEETLKVPFTLQFLGFEDEQQKAYLRNTWERRAQLLVKNWNEKKSDEFISNLLEKASAVLGRQGTKFISIPLQLRVMSVAFFEDYVKHLTSENNVDSDVLNFLKDLTLGTLYEKFVAAKYEIYRNEKVAMTMNKAHDKRDENAWGNGHRKLAISTFVYGKKCDSSEISDDLYRIGIVTKRNNEPASFIHHSFAAYFFAVDICDKMFNQNPECPRELLMDVLASYDLKLIRVFLEDLLKMKWEAEAFPNLTEETKIKFVKDYWAEAIHLACKENLANVLNLIFILRGNNQPISIKLEEILSSYFNRKNVDFYRFEALKNYRKHKTLTPLLIATVYGSLAVVKYMLTKFQICDQEISTALDLSVENGHLEIVKFILEGSGHSEVLITGLTINKEKPLHKAVYKGHLEVVKFLIEETNVDISSTDFFETTLIHRAAETCRVNVLTCILDKNVSRPGNERPPIDINHQTKYGFTALHQSVYSRDISCLQVLLERNICDLNLVNKDGVTVLHTAAKIRNLEAVKCLIDKGANVNMKSEQGHTPLHLLLNTAKELNLAECQCCKWNCDEFRQVLEVLKKDTVVMETEKFHLTNYSKLCENCKKIANSAKKVFGDNVVIE